MLLEKAYERLGIINIFAGEAVMLYNELLMK